MTLEELEAFITEKFSTLADQVGGLESKILSEVDKKNSGTAASISKELAKAIAAVQPKEETTTTETKTGEGGDEAKVRPTIKALETSLNDLRQQIADKDAAIERGNRESALNGVLSSKRVLAPNVLFKALKAEYGDKLQRDGDQWFVVDGDNTKTLESAVDGFLATDDGKAFLPSSGVNGAGSKESSTTSTVSPSEMSVGAMAMAALNDL